MLEGKNLAGTWKLEVTDDERLIAGTLVDWSITARYTSAAASGPQAVVTPTSGLVTTEAGGTASFTVKLDTAPTANVTIPVSSSDTTEGTVSTSSLIFTPSNWNMAQTVTVTGVNDAVIDGNIAYTIVLGLATSADPDFNGLNPTDVSVTNTDNDIPPTKFYVVNDASQNQTYEYSASGGLVESYSLNSGNTAPRGAASTIAGDKTWVVDANRKVYVYNTSGGLLGSWTAGTLASNATVEGIATNGTDVWIVDARSDKVYKYTGAATRLSGSQNATSSFSLNSGNTSPKDIVTDGTSLCGSSTTARPTRCSSTRWRHAGRQLDDQTPARPSPTGITIDPSNVSNIWIVDSGTDRVYQYDSAASRTSGSQSPSTSFALAAGNTNPQGIADPPAPSSELVPAPMTVGESDSPTWDAVAYKSASSRLSGSHDGSRLACQTPARSAPASHSVDQFMSRLEIELGTVRSATSVARMMAPHTRRWSVQRSDMSFEPLSDDLDATIESIVDDLVAIISTAPHVKGQPGSNLPHTHQALRKRGFACRLA